MDSLSSLIQRLNTECQAVVAKGENAKGVSELVVYWMEDSFVIENTVKNFFRIITKEFRYKKIGYSEGLTEMRVTMTAPFLFAADFYESVLHALCKLGCVTHTTEYNKSSFD